MEYEKLLAAYKRKQQNEKKRYEAMKQNPEFMLRNRERARMHYNKNREKNLEKYKKNKEYNRARSSYYYYKHRGNLELFQVKYPERYELVRNLIQSSNAPEPTDQQ
mgnify:CR=1 FL=1